MWGASRLPCLRSRGCNAISKNLRNCKSRAMSDSVTVRVAQGDLRGKRTKTKTGVPMCSFQGVPYAKPPIGKLRFMAPKPPVPWSGVKDAFQEGNVCPHKDVFFQSFVGGEDCLFLNIFTPKVPTSKEEPLIPVMVWFHGGGYHTGSGNSDVYGPDLLVKEGVILVTLNYRLAALGFLSMEDAGVSGNAGLKDQVAALRWVKENISQFGGDPNNVTIFGESAGGSSVQYHLLSDMSTGLFHRAISQSGSAVSWWSHTPVASARKKAFRLAELLGFPSEDPQSVIDFLQKVPVFDLVKMISKTSQKENKHRGDVFPFVPTIESGSVPGEEIFINDTPLNLLKAGKVHQVPYITGVNSHEGMLIVKEALSDHSHWKKFDDSFESLLIPLDMNVKIGSDQARSVAEKIKKFYFKDKPISYETRQNYIDLITDMWFGCGVNTTVKYHAAMLRSPVYYYQFSFEGEFGLFKKLLQINNAQGVSHGDDLGYLFSNEMLNYNIDPNSPSKITLARVLKMWTNFAKTGDPIPKPDALLPLKWEPSTPFASAYLDISADLAVLQNRASDRMQFWEELYKTTGTIYQPKTAKSKI